MYASTDGRLCTATDNVMWRVEWSIVKHPSYYSFFVWFPHVTFRLFFSISCSASVHISRNDFWILLYIYSIPLARVLHFGACLWILKIVGFLLEDFRVDWILGTSYQRARKNDSKLMRKNCPEIERSRSDDGRPPANCHAYKRTHIPRVRLICGGSFISLLGTFFLFFFSFFFFFLARDSRGRSAKCVGKIHTAILLWTNLSAATAGGFFLFSIELCAERLVHG